MDEREQAIRERLENGDYLAGATHDLRWLLSRLDACREVVEAARELLEAGSFYYSTIELDCYENDTDGEEIESRLREALNELEVEDDD